jgi:hypothetical protein
MVGQAYCYLKDFFWIVLSSLLLVLSFPSLDFGILAWVGLLPLFLAINGKGLRYTVFKEEGYEEITPRSLFNISSYKLHCGTSRQSFSVP